MLGLTLIVGLILTGTICTGMPTVYLLWMKRVAKCNPWNLSINERYFPTVDILVPSYNEAEVIDAKLRNLASQDYPAELIHLILIDSGSTDGTFEIVKKFQTSNPSLVRLDVIRENVRHGKAAALNSGLGLANGEIVVTTDADAFWEPSAIRTLVKYFADPSIGAVTGTESILNPNRSAATKSEVAYHDWYLYYRLGESKLHSTLVTNGEMMAYRRSAFTKFDETTGSDDSGTALELVRGGHRCIQTDEAKFFDNVYYTWKGKTKVKVRRAEQLVAVFFTCTKLAFQEKIGLPRGVLFFDVYLHIINPLVFLAFVLFFGVVAINEPLVLVLFLAILPVTRVRNYTISFATHNLFLVVGLGQYVTGRKQIIWKKVQETRLEPLSASSTHSPVPN